MIVSSSYCAWQSLLVVIELKDPNISNPPSSSNSNLPLWDPYDSVNQTYLELTENSTIKKHYRGHKMSLWLNLIPQLHRPGVDELSMSHHHFQEEEPQYYDGTVRRYLMQRPSFYTPPTTTTTPTPKAEPPTSAGAAKAPLPAPTTTPAECTNLTALGPAADAVRPTSGDRERERAHGNNLLNRWGPGSYQLYAPALLSAVVIGFLFLLNVLIFVFICHQRGRHLHDRRRKKRKRKEEVCEINSCCSSSSEDQLRAPPIDLDESDGGAAGVQVVAAVGREADEQLHDAHLLDGHPPHAEHPGAAAAPEPIRRRHPPPPQLPPDPQLHEEARPDPGDLQSRDYHVLHGDLTDVGYGQFN
ncbi:unnamed protein product [Bemisia tabaci]|uniref:Uncharacterized protein n=1 Tax=Bemisia tabaci TaxID=7038 RepID=A0A9P0A9Z0_BEMTA|nr:unnamed protein product [Bemisia tabaci]